MMISSRVSPPGAPSGQICQTCQKRLKLSDLTGRGRLLRSRFRRLTPRECAYVLALAELGPGAHTSREIAERFGTTSETLSSIRNQLVKKDVLYSPVSGMAEFRIPLTERYVLDHKPELELRARGSTVQRRPR
jgi:hypothetical protein